MREEHHLKEERVHWKISHLSHGNTEEWKGGREEHKTSTLLNMNVNSLLGFTPSVQLGS